MNASRSLNDTSTGKNDEESIHGTLRVDNFVKDTPCECHTVSGVSMHDIMDSC